MFIACFLYSQEIDSSNVLTPEEVCELRGHTVIEYNIFRENVQPQFVDYKDSTIVISYPKNRKTGVIYYCIRCDNWLLPPQWEQPIIKTLWSKENEEDNINIPDSTD